MFDTMVVPLDGSPFAADALPIGAALARDAGAGLRVVGIARSDAELALTYDPAMPDRVSDVGLDGVETVAVVDPLNAGSGLEQHLADHSARSLVVGGGHRHRPHLSAGVAHHLFATATLPLLIVNRNE